MRFVIVVLWLAILVPVASAQPANRGLEAFLRRYFANVHGVSDLRYASAFVNLTTGPTDAIVYLEGRDWCGSGGCTTLILAPEGSSFRVVTKLTIVQLPIRVLKTSTNGWQDISVVVSGGGVLSGYETRLRFNGVKYPSNPSVPPAQPLRRRAPGKIAISDKTALEPLLEQ